MSNLFAEEVENLYPWMYDMARRMCKNRSDVDDLVSETVLKILKNRDKYNRQYDLKPWCMVVMRNTYANWYQRNLVVTFHPFDDSYSASVKDDSDFVELRNLFLHYSRVSLNVRCLYLFAQGYTYEEISDMLNIKIGTVRSRIFNGRRVMRCVLAS